MAVYTYEKETETIRRQDETECEDKIRLKVLTEHIGVFHFRLCNEEFRTRKERDAALAVMDALRVLEKTMEEKYAIRKKTIITRGAAVIFQVSCKDTFPE